MMPHGMAARAMNRRGRSFMNDSVLFNLPPLAGGCSDRVKS
jgi:hypothetical protein